MTETSSENGDENSEVSPDEDFPGLSVTLDEARRTYDDEEQRRNSLESKTSMLIGINALIISLVSALLPQGPIGTGIIALPALLSAYYGLRILEVRSYDRPGKEIGEFFQYAKRQPKDLEDTLLVSYINSVEKNKKKNNEKVSGFIRSYRLTFVSMALIILVPVAQILFPWLCRQVT